MIVSPAVPDLGAKSKDSQKLSKAAMKAFSSIADVWELSISEQCRLLGCAESTLYKWKKNPPAQLDKDKLERISYILGIYKSLQILFPNPEQADRWIRKPNRHPLFNGDSALQRMLSGHVGDLYEVRKYLDSERGGW